MPTCRNCGFSQAGEGEFLHRFCDTCRPLKIEISNLQREEAALNGQIERLEKKLQAEKRKHANYLTQRKSQVEQEITLIREALND